MCPTATPTATSTCTLDLQGGNLTGSEWWVWQIYYNSEMTGGGAEENTVYHIANVRAVNATAHVTYNEVGEDDTLEMTEATPPERGFTNYDVPGAAVIDWSMDDNGSGEDPPRERLIQVGIVSEFAGGASGIVGRSASFVPAYNHYETMDAGLYVRGNDSTLCIDADRLFRGFSTVLDLDDGDIPIDALYSYQYCPGGSPFAVNNSAPPGPHDGYPFEVGEDDWCQWEWTFEDGRYISDDLQIERGFRWSVNRTIGSYNVAAVCEAPDAAGVFDVTEITRKNTYNRHYRGAGNYSPDPDYTRFYWNDSVKNFVRLLDLDTYCGREDWGIKAWESRRVNVTVNDFSDSGTGFDINVTVENNCQTCAEGNFSVLALIMDMDALTPEDSVPYINGKTIYPNVSSGWSAIGEAIQYTGDLAYGESTTLTWSNVGSSDTSHTYKLWCNGGTATIN
jgi:hypothetical protein